MKRLYLAAIAIALAQQAGAQPVQMVCQTPQFWCGFIAPYVAPNGYPCYCNTPAGQVSGFSVNPNGQAPQQVPFPQTPVPQPPQNTGRTPTNDECFRGLGNCPGAFSN
ncbi:hypothetical protein QA640_42725 [Bradyrhizobium sp. CB82]|jgi:hypothetical protein|uniref:hypothetical protein n=1 Tax=Bradyrhizobium sp. CB82 TaxID=3039159 RepID=UPI0024B2136E|nr:hypothetical protein [Bradyrhizobium sp. CB82]WFU40796.1 hypothetical protein QA640_42725 [Bradyrhizobium sp. CB82]